MPAVYAKDFATVKTTGSLALSGNVKGKYGKTAFPAFTLRTKVDNATFRYPDLPLPARDIFLDLGITNPGGSADNTTVNLSRLHLVLGKNPVDAALVLRTPISDPDVDARMQGTVDLADLRRTIKLDNVQQLAGVISADAAVRTRMSYVDKGQYDRVAARGTVDIRDLSVKSKALPHPLGITQASLVLAPERAQLKSFSGTVGSSDLRASGTLENLLGYVFRDDDLKGSASLASNKFVLDEWRSGEGELNVIPVPPKIDFALDATVKQLLYDKLVMSDARGKLRIKDQRITLENFSLNTLGGSIALTGYYETKDTTKPTFDMGLKLQKIDIPTAFAQLTTVQMLAPVAKYAKGSFSTDVQMKGALGQNMMPLLQGVTGGGSLLTSKVLIQDFPLLEKAAAVTKLNFLNDPTLNPINSGFDIKGGRLHVKPFSVALAGTKMDVVGVQRAGPVAGLRPQAPGAPEPDRRRQRRARRAGVEGGARPQGGADRGARHQGGRQRHQPLGQRRRRRRGGLGGNGRHRRGGGGGHAEGHRHGGLGQAQGDRRGREAGGQDPGRRQVAGREGEEGRLPAGRLDRGQGRNRARRRGLERRREPAPQGDRQQIGPHRSRGERAGRQPDCAGEAVGHERVVIPSEARDLLRASLNAG